MGSGMGPLADQTPVTDDGHRHGRGPEPDVFRAGHGRDAGPVLHAEPRDAPPARRHHPWICDGTPHQWITPAGETTSYPQGVSVQNVPDMNACGAGRDGCQTFYYTNQQTARLMFYHDHAWGITRLNVYAGEAAGYLLTDDVEQGP